MDGSILAIDPGTRYFGLAVSDDEQRIAFPLVVLDTTKVNLINELSTIIKDKQVTKILVGLPVSLRGTVLPMTAVAQKLSDTLSDRFNIPVESVDERLSTKQASLPGRQQSTKRVDAQAAALLLQSYLDAQR